MECGFGTKRVEYLNLKKSQANNKKCLGKKVLKININVIKDISQKVINEFSYKKFLDEKISL